MKTAKFRDSGFIRFLRHNGVFVAITIGLVAVCIVGLYGAAQTERNDKKAEIDHPVEQLVTDQPDNRTSTTSDTIKESTTAAETTTTTGVSEKELYVFPLSNSVQKPYSAEAPVYSETMKDWRLHLGTDFNGDLDATVKAIAKGKVSKIVDDRLWGNVVVIDHGVGVESRYCGVLATVKVGDEVEPSSPIGKLSDIPCELSQPSHLHLEILVDGLPVDPLTVIGLKVEYGENTAE